MESALLDCFGTYLVCKITRLNVSVPTRPPPTFTHTCKSSHVSVGNRLTRSRGTYIKLSIFE
jgi:hypothetical protein